MITFKKFLNEEQQVLFTDKQWNETTLAQIIETIKRDCGPYLNEIKDPLQVSAYRGLHIMNPSPLFLKKDVRTDRTPTDTPKRVSKLMDDWFEKKFGIRFRSEALFVSGSAVFAQQFGYVYIVFPIGDYDYCWSPVYGDLTDDSSNALLKNIKQHPEEYKYLDHMHSNVKKKHLEEIMEDGHYKFNKDLVNGLKKKSEVMIKCKSYYGIAATWEDVYSEILNGLK